MFDLKLSLSGFALGFSAGAVLTKIALILAIPPGGLALLMLVIVPVIALLGVGMKGGQGGFFTIGFSGTIMLAVSIFLSPYIFYAAGYGLGALIVL
jgi:hypothetical protein